MTNIEKLKLLSQKKSESFKQKLMNGDPKVKKTYYKQSEDERLWKFRFDKNTYAGKAVIRFLPNKNEEGFDVVTRVAHDHQHPVTKKWYIENSLTTLGKADPAYEYNGKIMQMYPKDSPARKNNMIPRKTFHFANILVIKDEATPENEGKVFIWKIGKSIYDKIIAAQFPEYDDEAPINPFDVFGSKNFRVVSKAQGEYPSFMESAFVGELTPLVTKETPKGKVIDEDAIVEICNKCYDLDKEILGAENFKTYEELNASLTRYLGIQNETIPTLEESVEPVAKQKPIKAAVAMADDSLDDDEEFMRNLMNEIED